MTDQQEESILDEGRQAGKVDGLKLVDVAPDHVDPAHPPLDLGALVQLLHEEPYHSLIIAICSDLFTIEERAVDGLLGCAFLLVHWDCFYRSRCRLPEQPPLPQAERLPPDAKRFWIF